VWVCVCVSFTTFVPATNFHTFCFSKLKYRDVRLFIIVKKILAQKFSPKKKYSWMVRHYYTLLCLLYNRHLLLVWYRAEVGRKQNNLKKYPPAFGRHIPSRGTSTSCQQGRLVNKISTNVYVYTRIYNTLRFLRYNN